MSQKVEQALERLIHVLPLKENQAKLGPEIKRLHQDILSAFVETGQIMSKAQIMEKIKAGGQPASYDAIKTLLENNDMVVFSENGEPVGAYPFTSEKREHKVLINGHQVYAMCALDALSVSPMFGKPAKVVSRCRVTNEPVNVEMDGKQILNMDAAGGLYFGILWAAANTCACCADSLCMEMMFLKNKTTAENWLEADPANREIFTLKEAVDFGARFFVPLME
ncbi:MAG: alkylmercury lyase family protein [Proteobacteria bacterium]|nr:alkylmercury lyase family protein [Pseudomonadota bacterium]MBU1386769.1 alkylmercury lyase family protein [Pseudomonadota bacterium]MBU1544713.1 alkylmercury lyase family protein [Pseudomonadota bacterium]MBU2431158.1 alkylmercury lyase family protein [Pseudomonadota bacterium]MBU2481868.1 alkylmercury lyase family protein [Pseudomonadota bacterium]